MPNLPADNSFASGGKLTGLDVDRLRGLSMPQLVEELRADQTRRWQAGERIRAEVYFQAFPALTESREDVLVIIVGEMLLLRETGGQPTLEEFQKRFLAYEDQLAAAFALNSAIDPDPRPSRAELDRDGIAATGAWVDQRETIDQYATSAYDPNTPPAEQTQRRPAQDGFPLVPGYEILGELKGGAMGRVFKARHTALRRLVALKMIRASLAGPQALERFKREAEAVARLQHPNIVQIFEIGSCAGEPFLSLEYVDGGSLAKKLNSKPQDPQEAARLIETLARAVHYAHQMQVAHRDLKPANVMLTKDGVPKLTDFGLAKQLDDASSLSLNSILGTPSYMAPEQADSKFGPMTELTDVYGLGAVLYECLTGRPPFKGQTIHETLLKVQTEEPVKPTLLQPKVPPDLETICLACLEKEQQKRYASALELADDLRFYLNGEPIRRRPAGILERLVRWCKRNPRVAALLALVFGLITTVAVTSTVFAVKLKVEKEATAQEWERTEDNARVAMAQADVALDLVYKQMTTTYTNLRDQSQLPPKLLDGLLNDAMKGLDDVAKRAEHTPLALRTQAGILQRKGDIYELLGRSDEALKQYEECLRMATELVQQYPEDGLAHRALGVVLLKLADHARSRGQIDKARAFADQSLQARRTYLSLHADDPDALHQMAYGFGLLGRIDLKEGTFPSAARHYEEEMRWRDRYIPTDKTKTAIARRERAAVLDKLGETCMQLESVVSARQYFEDSLQLRERVQKEDPDNSAVAFELTISLVNLGDYFFLVQKDPSNARGLYEKVASIRELIYKEAPHKRDMASALAYAHYRLATACLQVGDTPQAEIAYRRALELYEPLVKAQPIRRYGQPYMYTLARCGRHKEAEDWGMRLGKSTTTTSPELLDLAGGYALCLGALGHPQANPLPQPGDAERFARLTLETLRRALKQGCNDIFRLEHDPDLEPIRTHPEFTAIVEELKRARATGPTAR
jgi:serine/threonine-protein kinase